MVSRSGSFYGIYWDKCGGTEVGSRWKTKRWMDAECDGLFIYCVGKGAVLGARVYIRSVARINWGEGCV